MGGGGVAARATSSSRRCCRTTASARTSATSRSSGSSCTTRTCSAARCWRERRRCTGRDGSGADRRSGHFRCSVSAQRPDGSWPYAEGEGHGWVDNFHTGYVLEALAICEPRRARSAPGARARLRLLGARALPARRDAEVLRGPHAADRLPQLRPGDRDLARRCGVAAGGAGVRRAHGGAARRADADARRARGVPAAAAVDEQGAVRPLDDRAGVSRARPARARPVARAARRRHEGLDRSRQLAARAALRAGRAALREEGTRCC